MDFDKMKTDDYIRGVIVHVERLGDRHSNENIRADKSHLNYSLMPDGKGGIELFEDYKKAFEKVAAAQKRKVRSDAVRVVDGVLSLPAEYKGESEERQRAFFEEAARFTAERFGPLLWATVHRDERTKTGDGTDHLHVGFIPVTKDGRLSAREVIGTSSGKRKTADTEVLSVFHDDLDKRLRERLPWYHGGVVNENKELRCKSKDNLAMKQWKQVKAETDKVKAERDEAREEAVRQENRIHQMAQTYREKEASYSASLQQAEEKGAIAADLLAKKMSGERLTRDEKKTIKKDLWGYGLKRTEVETQLRHDESQLRRREEAVQDGYEKNLQTAAHLEDWRTKLVKARDAIEDREKNVEEREKAVAVRESAIDKVFQKVKSLVRSLFTRDRSVADMQEVKDIEKTFGRKLISDTERIASRQTHEKGPRTHGGMTR